MYVAGWLQSLIVDIHSVRVFIQLHTVHVGGGGGAGARSDPGIPQKHDACAALVAPFDAAWHRVAGLEPLVLRRHQLELLQCRSHCAGLRHGGKGCAGMLQLPIA